MNSNGRQLSDILSVIGHAKLESSQLQSTVQPLSFPCDFESENIMLFEVSYDLLDELLETGSLVMKGEEDEPAVLCTKNKTYEVREAETSNTMILVPDLIANEEDINCNNEMVVRECKVKAMKKNYYELQVIQPRVRKLKKLLDRIPYRGPEYDAEDKDKKKFTFGELMDKIQASEEELYLSLQDINACCLDGYWQVLDFEYMGLILRSILDLVEEESWSFNQINLKRTLDVLEELYNRRLIEHVLQCFATKMLAFNQDDECKLDEDKVCRYYAESILRPIGNFHFGEFLQVWQLAVPEGMTTSEDILKGIAMIDRDHNPPVVNYFPLLDLPDDVVERFNFLFKMKDKWTHAEIEPYVSNLATGKVGVGSLLTKFCRTCMLNGVRMFTNKRPII